MKKFIKVITIASSFLGLAYLTTQQGNAEGFRSKLDVFLAHQKKAPKINVPSVLLSADEVSNQITRYKNSLKFKQGSLVRVRGKARKTTLAEISKLKCEIAELSQLDLEKIKQNPEDFYFQQLAQVMKKADNLTADLYFPFMLKQIDRIKEALTKLENKNEQKFDLLDELRTAFVAIIPTQQNGTEKFYSLQEDPEITDYDCSQYFGQVREAFDLLTTFIQDTEKTTSESFKEIHDLACGCLKLLKDELKVFKQKEIRSNYKSFCRYSSEDPRSLISLPDFNKHHALLLKQQGSFKLTVPELSCDCFIKSKNENEDEDNEDDEERLKPELEQHLGQIMDDVFGQVSLLYSGVSAIVPASIYTFGVASGQPQIFPDTTNPRSITAKYNNSSNWSCRFYHLDEGLETTEGRSRAVAIIKETGKIFAEEKAVAYQKYPQLQQKVNELREIPIKDRIDAIPLTQPLTENDYDNGELSLICKAAAILGIGPDVAEIMNYSLQLRTNFSNAGDLGNEPEGTNCKNRLRSVLDDSIRIFEEKERSRVARGKKVVSNTYFERAYLELSQVAINKLISDQDDRTTGAENKLSTMYTLGQCGITLPINNPDPRNDIFNPGFVTENFKRNFFCLENVFKIMRETIPTIEMRSFLIDQFNRNHKYTLLSLCQALGIDFNPENMNKKSKYYNEDYDIAHIFLDPDSMSPTDWTEFHTKDDVEAFVFGTKEFTLPDIASFTDDRLGYMLMKLIHHSSLSICAEDETTSSYDKDEQLMADLELKPVASGQTRSDWHYPDHNGSGMSPTERKSTNSLEALELLLAMMSEINGN